MEIYVETLAGTRFKFSVYPCETVFSIKAKIMRSEGIPASEQDIIFRDKVLLDEDKFEDIDIRENDTLKLVIKMRGGPLSMRPVFLEDGVECEDEGKFDQLSNLIHRNSESSRDVTLIVIQKGGNLRILELHASPQPTTNSVLTSSEAADESTVSNTQLQNAPLRRPSMEQLNTHRPLFNNKEEPIVENGSTAQCNFVQTDQAPDKRDPKIRLERSMTELRLQRPRIDPVKLAQNSKTSTELIGSSSSLTTNTNMKPTRRILSKSFSYDPTTSRQSNYTPLHFGPSKLFSTVPPLSRSHDDRKPFLINLTQSQNSQVVKHPPTYKSSIEYVNQLRQSLESTPRIATIKNNPLPALQEKSSSRTKRCHVCSKRLMLGTDFECRCGHLFCSQHRYPEEHKCIVDFKAEGRIDIAKSNPLVIADKLPRI